MWHWTGWPWETAGDSLADNLNEVVATLGAMLACILVMVVGILIMAKKINILPGFWNGVAGLFVFGATALYLIGVIG
jgi:hypothetical protein